MKLIRKLIYPITIILFIAIFIVIIYLKNNLNNSKYNEIVESTDIVKEEPIKTELKKYSIDIKGAVNNPGVYYVDSHLTVNDVIKTAKDQFTTTVNDVISIAGGLTEQADTSVINLAKKITDEMVIIIYTKDEVKNSNIVDTVIKIVEKDCVCPNIQNDGCLNTEVKDNITNNENSSLININTATKEELMTIKGIGESKADSIIKYREENGNFKTIEDIKNIEGIGDKLYETIKIYITT